MSGDDVSVRVVVRARPPSARELDSGFRSCLSFPSKTELVLNSKPDPKQFTFDHCLAPETSQEEVFVKVGKPISETCLAGYNGVPHVFLPLCTIDFCFVFFCLFHHE